MIWTRSTMYVSARSADAGHVNVPEKRSPAALYTYEISV